MRVILLTDVPRVGIRHQVKDFKDGFAQNVLIAKGLAVMATPKALADLEKRKSEMKNKVNEDIKNFESVINILNNQNIIIKVKANEKGHLFKSVNEKDVLLAIKNIAKMDINPEHIIMENIKQLGNYRVILKNGNMEGSFQIQIESI